MDVWIYGPTCFSKLAETLSGKEELTVALSRDLAIDSNLLVRPLLLRNQIERSFVSLSSFSFSSNPRLLRSSSSQLQQQKTMADIEKQTTQAPAILPVEEQTYDPSSESPSLGSDSGITKRNSREKEQAVHDATLAHELAEDDLEVSSTFSGSLLFSHLPARSLPSFRVM